jgi:hypothetical protein
LYGLVAWPVLARPGPDLSRRGPRAPGTPSGPSWALPSPYWPVGAQNPLVRACSLASTGQAWPRPVQGLPDPSQGSWDPFWPLWAKALQSPSYFNGYIGRSGPSPDQPWPRPVPWASQGSWDPSWPLWAKALQSPSYSYSHMGRSEALLTHFGHPGPSRARPVQGPPGTLPKPLFSGVAQYWPVPAQYMR